MDFIYFENKSTASKGSGLWLGPFLQAAGHTSLQEDGEGSAHPTDSPVMTSSGLWQQGGPGGEGWEVQTCRRVLPTCRQYRAEPKRAACGTTALSVSCKLGWAACPRARPPQPAAGCVSWLGLSGMHLLAAWARPHMPIAVDPEPFEVGGPGPPLGCAGSASCAPLILSLY